MFTSEGIRTKLSGFPEGNRATTNGKGMIPKSDLVLIIDCLVGHLCFLLCFIYFSHLNCVGLAVFAVGFS